MLGSGSPVTSTRSQVAGPEVCHVHSTRSPPAAVCYTDLTSLLCCMPFPLLGCCRLAVDAFRSFRQCRAPRFRSRQLTKLATKPTLPPNHLDLPVMTQAYGNFDLLNRVKLDFTDVVVSKWRSRVTGLSVVHLDYEGA